MRRWVDDVVALAVLVGLGRTPARVVAVAGNVQADLAARNAAGALALLGLDVPVLQGAKGTVRDGGRHGADGFVGLASRLPEGAAPSAALERLGAGGVAGAALIVAGILACELGGPLLDRRATPGQPAPPC